MRYFDPILGRPLGPAAVLGTLLDRFYFPTWPQGDDLIAYMAKIGLATADGVPQMNLALKSAVLAASRTLTPAESGTHYFVTGVDLVATLPAVGTGAGQAPAGTYYTFTIKAAALSAGTGFSASPAAADFIVSTGLTAVDNKDLINSGASDDDGDAVTLVSDGVDGWFARDQRGTWAKEP